MLDVRFPSSRSDAVAQRSVYPDPNGTVITPDPIRVITGILPVTTFTVRVIDPVFPATSVCE